MPKILLQAWEKFFSIQHAQPEDSNKLFHKLLEDLQIINKELAEYINSSSWNRPTFLNDNEEHYVQYKEYLENPSKKIAALNFNQKKEGPPQDSDICQLIGEECCIKDCREQKKIMEDTMLELVEVCRQKEFYCMHNDVDDLIESALNSKLLSINLRSQRLDKEKKKVKNIIEQPTERGTRIAKTLQNFRVQSSISLNNTSQISPVHAITPVLPTKEPEYSLSIWYEHLSTILETESDEVTEPSVEKLVPISSEYEVTSEDKRECDVPVCKDSSTFDVSEILSDSNDDDISSDDNAFENVDDHTEETRSGNTTTHANNSFPEYDSFCFEIDPDQEKFTTIVMNDISDDSSNDPLLEEVNLFLASDHLIPQGIENNGYDSKGDIHFFEELLVDDSILFPENESSNFDHQDDLSFLRPLPEPPDVEFFFDLEPNSGEEISKVMNNFDELNEDECFDPGGEIIVFANVEDDDYFPFIFFIRIFLPYLTNPEVSPLFLSAKSEDTIFDPGISI
uniref:Reverse transcriptase domain-containing protein n=1 Tax=Tanacetum cinerariifolium TaxID=118510 RepID=A0A699H8K1_TANCI|nr:hypothetical protein [Tanacetum cinerariifolium]